MPCAKLPIAIVFLMLTFFLAFSFEFTTIQQETGNLGSDSVIPTHTSQH